MKRTRTKILCCIILLLCACTQAVGQDMVSDSLTLSVFFRRDKSDIDLSYKNNAGHIAAFRDTLDERLKTPGAMLRIIIITAYTSPEGRTAHNDALSKRRAKAIRNYLKDYLALGTGIYQTRAPGENWDGLYEMVLESGQPWADEVASIIKNDPVNRKQRLQALQGGKVWDWMDSNLFPMLRGANGTVLAILNYPKQQQIEPVPVPEPQPAPEPEPKKEEQPAPVPKPVAPQPEPKPEPKPETAPLIEPQPAPQPEPELLPIPVQEDIPAPGLYLYNNLALDALLIPNLGFEADLSDSWSVAVPIFYSGWNWFGIENTKFRCLGTRPEIRWWPFPKHIFYVGAHAGATYYNIAFRPLSNTYRYQDTDGKTPLYGGGLDVGARIPISKRVSILVSAGAGVYSLSYDMFYLGKNGRQAYAAQQKTYFGPDFLQLSVVYRFNRLTDKEKR